MVVSTGPMRAPPLFRTLGALAALASAAGCGAPKPKGAPVPALAKSSGAAEAFSLLRRRFAGATREDRISLRPYVADLAVRYEREPAAKMAEVYLAWIALEEGRHDEALARAARAATDPGNARDLATLIEGATLAHRGDASAGLDLMMPLVGKLLDPYARDLLHAEATRAARDAARHSDVVRLFDVWLRDVPEEDRAGVLDTARRALGTIPVGTLERSLVEMMEEDGAGIAKHSDALMDAILARLAGVALDRNDAALARRLLREEGGIGKLGDRGAALVELAATAEGVPTVSGRRVGLLLPEGSARASVGAELIDGAVGAARPTLGEPSRFVSRSDGASLDETRAALAALGAEGVAVVIGGVDRASAGRLAEAAEAERMPVLLLAPPDTTPGPFALRFGPDPTTGASAALEALHARGARVIAVVGADRPLVVDGGAKVLPPLSCPVITGPRAVARFPWEQWRRERVDAILLAGDARCALDLMTELGRADTPLGVGPLAASATLSPPRGSSPARKPRAPAALATLGCFPSSATRGWWSAVGADALQVALDALSVIPDESTKDQDEVTRRRAAVLRTLASAPASPCLGLSPRRDDFVAPWRVTAGDDARPRARNPGR